MTQGWHVDQLILAGYVTGTADAARASSIEAHLVACDFCRQAVGRLAPPLPLEEIWDRVEEAVDAPRPGLVERLMLILRVPDHMARLLAATRSLRLSWFAAIGFALAFAVVAARAGTILFFLTLAPLIPVAGVAVAYGPWTDPTYEIGLASPMRSHRLLLIRSVAVIATSTVLAGVAALALPHLNWTAAAWLLPGLGLSASSLALSTYRSPVWAAGSVAALWIAAVLYEKFAFHRELAAFGGRGQLVFVLIVAASALLLLWRRETFDARSAT